MELMGVERNQLKKNIQVEVNVKSMHTNFGGCGYFGYEVKIWRSFSFGPSMGGQKIELNRIGLKIRASKD